MLGGSHLQLHTPVIRLERSFISSQRGIPLWRELDLIQLEPAPHSLDPSFSSSFSLRLLDLDSVRSQAAKYVRNELISLTGDDVAVSEMKFAQ